MIFISVDLPLPLTPTSPIRSPSCRVNETSLSTSLVLKDFFTPCRERRIIGLLLYAPIV